MTLNKRYGGYSDEISDNVMTSMQIAIPMQDAEASWRRCGNTADFFSKVYSQWFYNQDKSANVLSIVVNELIENAAKYSRMDVSPVQILFRTFKDHLEVEAISTCDESQATRFDEFLSRFDTSDPKDFYQRQLLESALSDTTQSRIGLSLLRMDYGADVSCKIADSEEFEGYYEVCVKASLHYEEVDNL